VQTMAIAGVTPSDARRTEQMLRASVGAPSEGAPRYTHLVPRHHLFKMLDRTATEPLVIVSAPAGTGKTAAAAQWARSGRSCGPVLWISLTRDADLADFWRTVGKGLSAYTPERVHLSPRLEREDDILSLAEGLVRSPEIVTLIVDCDVELPCETATRLHQLLAGGGGQLRLVVLSRRDPLLPLHLYRLNESCVEIRMTDLAFTPEEASELFAVQGVRLPDDTLARLVERTGGWAAALEMAAMALAAAPDTAVAAEAISGRTGPISEFLITNVLDVQSPATRRLLLQTSVAEYLTQDLADVLAGPDTARGLTALAAQNAFVAAVPGTSRYRYHPLFRELLASKLMAESPTLAQHQYQVGCRWLSEHESLDDGVQMAVSGGMWEEAARAAVEGFAVVRLIGGTAGDGFVSSLSGLPSTATSTSALVVRAAIAVRQERLDDAMQLHHRAVERMSDAAPDDDPLRICLAVLEAVLVARTEGGLGPVRHAVARAQALLATRSNARPELQLAVDIALAEALFRDGDFPPAAAIFREAMAHVVSGYETYAAECASVLALVAAWSGRSREVTKFAHRIDRLAEGAPAADAALYSESVRIAKLALAWTATDTAELRRAEEHAAAAAAVAADSVHGQRLDSAMVTAVSAVVSSRIRYQHHDVQGARDELGAGAERSAMPAWVAAQLSIEGARIDLLTGQPQSALALPHDFGPPSSDRATLLRAEAQLRTRTEATAELGTHLPSNLLDTVQYWLVAALDRLAEADEYAATKALRDALRAAAPERLRRPFVEAPDAIRQLIGRDPTLAARAEWLSGRSPQQSTVLSDLGTAPPGRLAPVLTQKEREVLVLLAQLLTTEETAAALFVSVNTVRTHVRNILHKLGAPTRNQAIRRARELGLLPPGPSASLLERPLANQLVGAP
jgi:LuxR family maltose regulon positive regulatory protein